MLAGGAAGCSGLLSSCAIALHATAWGDNSCGHLHWLCRLCHLSGLGGRGQGRIGGWRHISHHWRLLGGRGLADHIDDDGIAGLVVENEEDDVPAHLISPEVQAVVSREDVKAFAGDIEGVVLKDPVVVRLAAHRGKGDELHPGPSRNYDILGPVSTFLNPELISSIGGHCRLVLSVCDLLAAAQVYPGGSNLSHIDPHWSEGLDHRYGALHIELREEGGGGADVLELRAKPVAFSAHHAICAQSKEAPDEFLIEGSLGDLHGLRYGYIISCCHSQAGGQGQEAQA